MAPRAQASDQLLATTPLLAVIALAAWLVPKRARRGGRRHARFPWKTVGNLCLLGIPAMAVLALAGYVGWFHVLRMVAPCMIAHAGCRYLATRSKSKPLERVLQDDHRPPVLYLRPFERKDDYFAMLKNQQCEAAGVPIRNPSAFRQTSRFEEFLRRRLPGNSDPLSHSAIRTSICRPPARPVPISKTRTGSGYVPAR